MHFQTMREGVYRLAFALMLNVSKWKRVLNGLNRSLSARDAEMPGTSLGNSDDLACWISL